MGSQWHHSSLVSVVNRIEFYIVVFSLVAIRDLGGGVDMYRVSGPAKTQITICPILYLFPHNPLFMGQGYTQDFVQLLCSLEVLQMDDVIDLPAVL